MVPQAEQTQEEFLVDSIPTTTVDSETASSAYVNKDGTSVSPTTGNFVSKNFLEGSAGWRGNSNGDFEVSKFRFHSVCPLGACTPGDVGYSGGKFYLCSATNTWVSVGPNAITALSGVTITDSNIDGGTVDSILQGEALYAIILTASENLKYSADTERTENNDAYVLKKEIMVRQGGVIRVKFDLKTLNSGNGTSYARIYVNGVAAGTERNADTDAAYDTFSEDISIKPFDLVQLYIKNTSGDAGQTAYIRNFRIYYDRASTSITAIVNTD